MSRLNMDFNETEDNKIEELKDHYGLSQTTELIRLLITKEVREINKDNPLFGSAIRYLNPVDRENDK